MSAQHLLPLQCFIVCSGGDYDIIEEDEELQNENFVINDDAVRIVYVPFNYRAPSPIAGGSFRK